MLWENMPKPVLAAGWEDVPSPMLAVGLLVGEVPSHAVYAVVSHTRSFPAGMVCGGVAPWAVLVASVGGSS